MSLRVYEKAKEHEESNGTWVSSFWRLDCKGNPWREQKTQNELRLQECLEMSLRCFERPSRFGHDYQRLKLNQVYKRCYDCKHSFNSKTAKKGKTLIKCREKRTDRENTLSKTKNSKQTKTGWWNDNLKEIDRKSCYKKFKHWLMTLDWLMYVPFKSNEKLCLNSLCSDRTTKWQ